MPTQWYLPHCLNLSSDRLMDLMDLMVKVSDEHYLVTMNITWLPRRTLLGYHDEHYLVTTTSITWLP